MDNFYIANEIKSGGLCQKHKCINHKAFKEGPER